jgi:hypothetical protein
MVGYGTHRGTAGAASERRRKPLGSDLDRIGKHVQFSKAQLREMRQPIRPIGEARLGLGRQTGDQHGGQLVRRVIEHVRDIAS